MNLKIGDRIELVKMTDDPDPIEPGTQGTVDFLSELFERPTKQWQIGVKWDNGRTLGLITPPDKYRKL
jgi:hypothetical protein